MSTCVVVVESPAKCKTIKKYLGKDYEVLASYGHVRDLLPKEGAVDPNNHFCMTYEMIEKNSKHVDAIAKALQKADTLYLATDPDREGEAISWHVQQLLAERGLLKNKTVHRVAFHEITKSAIQTAINEPRQLSEHLVNAQQARRALDYLVGFNLSPLLWRKVRPGLSAGRVQSPALRMIVERELEIEAFVQQEYWSIIAHNEHHKQSFDARLNIYDGQKQEQFSITTAQQSKDIKAALEQATQGQLLVHHIEKKQRKRQPAAPFTTSTLQQEASRKLGFTARRTMQIAQQLYEGVDVGQGAEGLITYMRTDSVSLSEDAINEIRHFIATQYGQSQVPNTVRIFKTKSKNAQEAHEAIRPTSVLRKPDDIRAHLNKEQFALYQLIWKRAVASQMLHATMDTISVDLICPNGDTRHQFRANGSTLVDPGFIAVYLEGKDDNASSEDDEKILPVMQEGDLISLKQLECKQHFTEPPPRYSEASLVKALEEYGIGRPSTYASIIHTLTSREYVILDKKRFHPTDVGRIVNKFLTNYFTQYVDYDFTAQLEDSLDDISRGEKQWIPLLESFWDPFKHKVDDVAQNVQRKDVTQEALEEKCPDCGKQLSIRLGKRGRFIGCSGYPECSYTRNLEGGEEEAPAEPEIVEGRQCPTCSGPLLVKSGRYGKFIGCSAYPKCKHMEPLEKPKNTAIECPECKKGTFLERKSRYGKLFYSCSEYPTCKYAVWNPPIDEPCPKCQWPILTHKTTKRWGDEKACPQKECGYKISIENPTVTDNNYT